MHRNIAKSEASFVIQYIMKNSVKKRRVFKSFDQMSRKYCDVWDISVNQRPAELCSAQHQSTCLMGRGPTIDKNKDLLGKRYLLACLDQATHSQGLLSQLAVALAAILADLKL